MPPKDIETQTSNQRLDTHIGPGIRVGAGVKKQPSTVSAAKLNGQNQRRVSVLGASKYTW
jgi:hypothetical protein